MSCCGRNTTSTRETNAAAGGIGLPSGNPTPLSPAAAGAVWLRYVGSSGVTVRGPVTRRHYIFSGMRLIQRVDGRDATSLLRTGMFKQTW